ncbi:BLUF domain-containing protein [Pedobacter cryophilus]|uniref:BLUF domain-containing protein n=1 Tax=Pedobacter cryophilus TaxID=2571271 RepID=A0A4U1BT60_9SPHI|nr:BLUF domain-containing protein [Pedobacter cryophilus]TKB95563.1 BLUF domain-containing protein [Pedobacter cryophilus]
MFELIYISKAKPGLTADDINNILETAIDFNQRNNVTGCLLYHNQEFIQILEGDKKIVKDLYANIWADDRHYDVTLLSEGEKEEREFKSWSMAYHELSDDDRKKMSQKLFANNFIALSELADKPTPAIKLFWSMAKQLLMEDEKSSQLN